MTGRSHDCPPPLTDDGTRVNARGHASMLADAHICAAPSKHEVWIVGTRQCSRKHLGSTFLPSCCRMTAEETKVPRQERRRPPPDSVCPAGLLGFIGQLLRVAAMMRCGPDGPHRKLQPEQGEPFRTCVNCTLGGSMTAR